MAYLAAGQTKVESFTITLSDQNGGVITRQIDVTITGTNDAAVLSSDTRNLTETNAALIDRRHADDQRRRQRGDLRGAGRHGWRRTAPSRSALTAPGPTPRTRRTTSSWPAPPTPTPSRCTSADGTFTSVTVNILGTNDAAVLSSDTRNLTETNCGADAPAAR